MTQKQVLFLSLCTLRSRKTKSVFCIPQCTDPKNKVCFGTMQRAEPKNRSCFRTSQRAKPKNRLCFRTLQRAEPQNRLCFPTLQRAELPFRVCFYIPQMARQQLNKPFYSHSAYGPISTQTVFPSWRKKSSPHVSRRGSSILTVIKWCENFQVLNLGHFSGEMVPHLSYGRTNICILLELQPCSRHNR